MASIVDPNWLGQKVDDLYRAVTPESEGERIVNQIYGSPGVTNIPEFDYADLGTPAIIVAAKKKVKSAVSGVSDSVSGVIAKYGIIAIAVLIVSVLVLGLAQGYGRGIASR